MYYNNYLPYSIDGFVFITKREVMESIVKDEIIRMSVLSYFYEKAREDNNNLINVEKRNHGNLNHSYIYTYKFDNDLKSLDIHTVYLSVESDCIFTTMNNNIIERKENRDFSNVIHSEWIPGWN